MSLRDTHGVRRLIARKLLDGAHVPEIRKAVALECGARETDPEVARVVASVKDGLAEALRPGRYASTGRTAAKRSIGKRKRATTA